MKATLPPRRARASRRRHWESIYRTKAEVELSWHQEEPDRSLRLIRSVAPKGSRIVDVGGGSSPLAGRLRRLGYDRVMVLDVSPTALTRSRSRSPEAGAGIRYQVGDVTALRHLGRFDLWHDRAVLHFLTRGEDRRHYVDLAARTVPVGGHLVLATFALDGPETCSGLPVARYDAAGLAKEFGRRFLLVARSRETHTTPWGAKQPFTYAVLRRIRAGSAGRVRRRTPPARADPG